MEPIYRESFEIHTIHLDRYDRVKPSVLLYFAQQVAANHCTALSLDWDTLHKKHLFWAIARQKMQITRLPMAGETITVETWPMPTTRVAYPRSTVGYDAQGKELFRAISLWVLVDTDTRNMILPGQSGIAVQGTLRGLELPAPRTLMPRTMVSRCVRQVGFSLLDRNGHMNNTRYMDWVMDLLPSSFHETHPIREITLCYQSEATEGEEVELSWELSDNSFTVNGRRLHAEEGDAHRQVFSVQAVFDNIL